MKRYIIFKTFIQLFTEDGQCHCIPIDEKNRDYQEYLEWLNAGNTPEVGDEVA